MLKDLFQGVSKFFTNERIVVLVIFLILVWGLLAYSGNKSLRVDTFGSNDYSPDVAGQMHKPDYASNEITKNNVNSLTSQEDNSARHLENDNIVSAGSKKASPSDLLPNDKNSQWSTLNPNSANKGDVLMPDLLQAGYHIGLDTIGQTLRNANLQLRSDPVIPKSLVGPWNQSTIEPDLGRVPLELGAGPQ
jgi:hypothetical protein